ncbi:amino acid adenylation domain-containing protein [Agrobacterium vitis]|nr:amino acid adenylation domain-containing protein [Agrobacterium vitis]MCM2438765.1 amino acid adenylation domain-containing protein [Agrobacterium vitis]
MSDLCFIDRIHDADLENPDAAAIVFHGKASSYRDLAKRASALSATFHATGLSIGCRVGIHLRRSPDLIATLLAVLKLGATFVPLPIDSPVERNKLVAEMADLHFLVVDDKNSGSFPARTRIPLDGINTNGLSSPPALEIDDDTLAYIMFTSGSTGRPKGVMVRRRNVSYFLGAVEQLIRFREWRKMLAATTFGFDISILELLLPLAHGGTILLADDHESKSSEELIRLGAAQGRCLVQATPTMWRMIVSSGWFEESEIGALCGGEALPFDLARKLHDHAAIAWNLYGPTETTIWSFGHRLSPEDFTDPARSVSIGRPLEGTGYAIDTTEPDGRIGELRIAGPGVAAGYFRRPDLDADRFVASATGGTLEYRTGDMVEERSDGTLGYVGRKDRQVKLNGFRIEPGEIEHVLNALPGVAQSAIKLAEDNRANKRLVAYVVSNEAIQDTQALENWGSVWDASYTLQRGSGLAEETGYTSSFTGKPIEEEAVRAWASATADRVLQSSVDSVLDVGCGVGLLGEYLLNTGVSNYHGCDLSGAAIEAAHGRLTDRIGSSQRWTLSCVPAHDLRANMSKPVDLVVLNSVVQYFPDKSYLSLVLSEAVDACRTGGKIIIGDIPAVSLRPSIAAEMRLAHPKLSDEVFASRANEIGRGELWLDPAEIDNIVRKMKRVAAVEIDLRLGDGEDEMTRFRYDVILHLDTDDRKRDDSGEVFKFDELASSGIRLSQWLASAPGSFILKNIPNRRLRANLPPSNNKIYDGIASDISYVAADFGPHEIRTWANENHRSVCIRWSEPVSGAKIDIAVTSHGSVSTAFESPRQSLTDEKDITPFKWYVDRARDEKFRAALLASLPQYMVPSTFVYLSRMPLTHNGKVDYSALPVSLSPTPIKATKEITGSARDRIASVWSSILDVPDPPLDRPFLAAGGSSILVTELARQLSSMFGVKIPIVDFFVHTTVTSQAAHIEGLVSGTTAGSPPEANIHLLAQAERRHQALAKARSRRNAIHEE